MKTPIYETSAGALRALLLTRSFVTADLYTISLVNGATYRFTTADVDILVSGVTWDSHTVRFDDPNNRATGNWKTGLNVDTWQVMVYPRLVNPLTGAAYPDQLGSLGWTDAVNHGALDGATITVDRAYLANWPTVPQYQVGPTGVYRIFVGRTADIDMLRGGITLNINSLIDMLGVQMPLRVYQQLCIHRLFDPGCGLNPASFVRTGTVAPGISRIYVNTTIAAPGGSGTFTLGKITMTSGPNSGTSRTIKLWTAGTGFELVTPFYYVVSTGETFNAYPGCDKVQSTCKLFFGTSLIANTNYGGTDYVPPAEAAI